MKRRMLLALAAATLACVWVGPLPALAPHDFSAHMTMHMGVVAVAAPLLALGIGGTRLDPVPRWPRLFSPVPASILELVVVWAWHAPALHVAARHTASGLLLEQGAFLASGLLVWMAAVGGAADDRERHAGGVVALLLTSMHMTLLGALIALSPRALYAHGAADVEQALAQQHLGGAIMLLVGGIAYLAGGLWLSARVLRGPRLLEEPTHR